MRVRSLVAGACAAALIPTAALAQQTCQERAANRVAGTVVGAGVGALAGSAVAGRGDRNEGAVIGGIAGAIIGNQLAKGGKGDCARAYGYYDNEGDWHASSVARTRAVGYYDRNGNWVVGAPAGRWDSRGYYVPAAQAGGYYGGDGRWIGAPRQSVNYGRDDRQIDARIARLDDRIRRSFDNGSLSRREAREASRELDSIRAYANSVRTRRGGYRERDEVALNDRLDRLSDQIREDRRDRDGRRY